MKLTIDQSFRFANARAHTATHLLHAELQKIFPDTKQAGSWVGDDELRFDFSSQRMLSNQEIYQIEKNINNIIYQWLKVNSQEMSYQEAIDLGAKAFFEDKYWDVVRVVSVLQHSDQKTSDSDFFSLELCGWTHVANTREIGVFVITWQEAVASWVKRISAFVWPKVISLLQQKTELLDNVMQDLWVKSHIQIQSKISKLLNDYRELQNKSESLETKILNIVLQNISSNIENKLPYNFDIIYNIDKDNVLSDFDFKSIVLQTKKIFTDKVCLFVKDNGSYAIISNLSWVSAKNIMQELWRKWGWNDNLVQWRTKFS